MDQEILNKAKQWLTGNYDEKTKNEYCIMSADINLIKSVLSLHDEMASNGFSLVYEGEFSHEVMKMFTSMAERDMDKSNEDKSVKRKVFHVMVECLQNMTKHSDDVDKNDGVGNGLFIVGKKDGYWSVITANKIMKEKIDGLKASIDSEPSRICFLYKALRSSLFRLLMLSIEALSPSIFSFIILLAVITLQYPSILTIPIGITSTPRPA